MIARDQQIRRRTNGTIDIDHYRAKARAERAAVKLWPGRRLLSRALIAGAMTLGPAVIVAFLAAAGMVHVIKGAPSMAAANTSATHSIGDRAAAARKR